MNVGVRPNKLWHWIAIITLTATFLHEPVATGRVLIAVAKGAGQVGGALITYDPTTDPNHPDYIEPPPEPTVPDTPTNPDQGPALGHDTTQPDPPEGEGGGGEAATYNLDAPDIRGVLDTGRAHIAEWHSEVVDAQNQGGFTIAVGTGGNPTDEGAGDGS